MVDLRDVDYVYGAGSLRVLAALDHRNEKINRAEDIITKVNDYFKTDNTRLKTIIAKELLSEDDLNKFRKRKELHRKVARRKPT